jgi:hypothetical protein
VADTFRLAPAVMRAVPPISVTPAVGNSIRVAISARPASWVW